MITHADWQVRNSQRRYPIDEGSSATADNGTVLPESFLVDANIWVPKYLYSGSRPLRYVYLSSVNVSAQLVSLTLLGCSDYMGSPETFVPLASISLMKPIEAYKNYALEPLLDGVMGWVAFGHLVNSADAAMSLSFGSPAQATLCPKAARFYDYLPIPDASAYDGFSKATGDVRIVANSPLVAEIKDMRLSGETVDRKMLVLSLTQTEDVLSQFAGLCGKRPETGNCLKTPITSIAGIRPDCSGNIQISFDSEIIVRYFSNPLYPVDPLPIRGGMCLDSVYTLDDSCSKVRTLPDAAGFLPGELIWHRPCDLKLPFSATFTDNEDFKQVVLLAGYVYIDGYDASVTAGMDQSAELAPCFPTLVLSDTEPTKRSHQVTFKDVPKGGQAGMFTLDTTNTRVLITVERTAEDGSEPGLWEVSRFSKALNSPDSVVATGTWGDAAISSVSVTVDSDRLITVKVNGVVLALVTLAADDVYYDPEGKTGIYVGGADKNSYTPRPAVTLDDYTVVDGDL